MSFEVKVGPGVFVPRPETQSLVEHAIAQAQVMAVREVGLHIVDLCSGSGVVAISLARAVLHASVVAVEASASAVEYLRHNVDTLAPNITVVESDVVSFWPECERRQHRHDCRKSPVCSPRRGPE